MKKLFECLDNACVFDNGESCSALNEKKCKGCKFRKNEEEYAAGRKKAEKRLSKLPELEQQRIRDTYHCKITQKY